jgi:pilus assembly protein CpaC
VAKFITEPRLITLSGRSASLLSGGEQAIPVPAGLGQVGVQFEEFGTRLNFLPIVMGDGRIHLEVEPEVSALSNSGAVVISGATVQGRTTQRVHTTVELQPGQTFVLGGLIQHQSNANDTKIPIVGEIPFLNVFFSDKADDETDQELLVIVTPYLVDSMDCAQLPKLLPGQETRSPDDFELFLEGILEAPRGPREVNLPCGYQAAYKNSPSAAMFPCAGGAGHCGRDGFGNGTCGAAGCNGDALSAPLTGSPVLTPPAAPVPPTIQPNSSSRLAPPSPLPRVEDEKAAAPAVGAPTPPTTTTGPTTTSGPTTLPPADGER